MVEIIKKLKRKSLITVLMKKNMLETDYDVFIDDVIKSFMNKYNDIVNKWNDASLLLNLKAVYVLSVQK